VRVSGEVVSVEDEESGELEVELGEKAVLRRWREGVRSGENDWKREVCMVTVGRILVNRSVQVVVGISRTS
jgi:hypothetical protein